MSYYKALGLVREPFSNSPDPDLLYRAPSHLECLQHMEIAVRLRRGLNVVLGEVGTGKTTLGRELTRLLDGDDDIEVHFIDDPYHATPEDFLLSLARLFGLDPAPLGRDAGLLREALKAELLRRGQDGRRIVALIVDEGQKITPPCLELLRELLNFETNTHKLLQIVIFAQNEFEDVLAARPNLEDRVNFRYRLLPLTRTQTRRMIETRLALCSPQGRVPAVFTSLACRRIHRLTGGYPRKIVRLCHLSMLLAVGFGRQRIGWGLVGRAAREQRGGTSMWLRRGGLAAGCALAGLITVGMVSGQPPFVRHGADILTRAVASLSLAQAPAPALAPSGDRAPAMPAASVAEAALAKPAVPLLAAHGGAAVSPAVEAPAASPAAGETPETVSPTARAVPATAETVAPESGARQGRDMAAALDLAAAALPPNAPENIIVVAPDDGLPAASAVAAAAISPELPPAMPVAGDAASGKAAAPGRIGACVVRPGWSVSRLAARLYGNGGREVLSRLAAANPGKNFNQIRAGETLVYPPIEAAAPPAGTYLVKVAGVDGLEKGFGFIFRHARQAELTLFCTRLPDASLRFDVVLPVLYPNQAAAEAALAGLPRELAARAVLLGGYPAGTTYFTELGSVSRPTPGVTRAVAAKAPVRQVAERQPSPLPGQP
ncbi:MAG: AAA family ATPase [Desulfovibrio sp.]